MSGSGNVSTADNGDTLRVSVVDDGRPGQRNHGRSRGRSQQYNSNDDDTVHGSRNHGRRRRQGSRTAEQNGLDVSVVSH
jgi:hypothetical protein